MTTNGPGSAPVKEAQSAYEFFKLPKPLFLLPVRSGCGASARFKQAIKPIDNASEAILALKPVSFSYKPEIDPEGIPQFGLLAEDVEKVNPDLIGRDENGVNTVRYEAVNAMLLNEFLKAHRDLQELKAIVAEQRKQIERLAATVQKGQGLVQPRQPGTANDPE